MNCLAGAGGQDLAGTSGHAGQSKRVGCGFRLWPTLSGFTISKDGAGDPIQLASPPGKAPFAGRFHDKFVTTLASSCAGGKGRLDPWHRDAAQALEAVHRRQCPAPSQTSACAGRRGGSRLVISGVRLGRAGNGAAMRVVAGAPGFEPGNGGTKNRCLTAWRRPNVSAGLAAPPDECNRQ